MGYKVKKVSLLVLVSVVADFAKVFQVMGVLCFALVSELLGSVLTDLKVIFRSFTALLPPAVDGDIVRCVWGASLELIQGRVSELQCQFDLLEGLK